VQSKHRFHDRVQPSTYVAAMCGNMYCGSVWGGLVSLLSKLSSDELSAKRVGVFSYGSGLASSFFSLRVRGSTTEMAEKIRLQERLDSREVVSPQVYDEVSLKDENLNAGVVLTN
jgi:hydroxymethylglutaryl-CoA synthase